MPNFQNNFATNLTSATSATDTTSPLNSIPTVDAPFYIAFDATNINSHYEVQLCTSKTATNVNHAALAYDHTTTEEVRLIVPAAHYLATQNAPRGFLMNGKIAVTAAAGITVAIKTLAGNDPSVSDPVYCRIGDTIQTITAALSVAKADGTNWFNSGSTEINSKDVDYFVYLGYNATDGVVIGFSRIPYGTKYNNFSTTSTDETYCAISTITTADANDPYENIGRFGATLSGGAGYTWSVPAYVNQNLIQRPIFETRLLNWQPVYSASGSMTFGTVTTTFAKYKISGSNMYFWIRANGTTGGTASTSLIATAPMAIAAVGTNTAWGGATYDTAQIAAFHYFTDGTNAFNTRKHDSSNYGLGAGRIVNASICYPLSLVI